MSVKPLVSVLMTSYNREKYIGEAIESVLASSYPEFELIICDDCSADNTVDIAKDFAAKDSRIRVLVNEKNLGDYANRNRVASYAKGKYLKYLDSDDKIYPWGLEAMVGCMEKFPAAGFGLMSFDLDQPFMYPIPVKGDEAYRQFFFKGKLLYMGPSGAIFRRDAFEAVNGFSGKPYVGDSEMWLKMARHFTLVRMPFDLIWWRAHDEQQIREGNNNKYYLINQFIVYKEALTHSDCPMNGKERDMALRNLKNVRARQIIMNYFLRLRWKFGFSLLSESDLKFMDFLKAFRRNQYPNTIIQP